MAGRLYIVSLIGALISLAPASNAQMPSMKEAPKCQKLMDALQEDFKSYSGAPAAAGTDAKGQKIKRDPIKDLFPRYMLKFEELAKAERGSYDGGMALVMLGILQMEANQTEAARQTLNVILKDYMDKPAMELMVTQLPNLSYVNGPDGRRKTLETVAHSASRPDARAAGLLTLARIKRLESREPSQKDPAVAGLLHEIMTKHPGTRYAETAAGMLAALGNLTVGKTAPEITGEDQDGKPFKLSSYRGRVVVLDFWGFW